MKNTLVIINGVTGAIGSACLARFSRVKNVTVIGLSRQGKTYQTFCKGGLLPNSFIICSLGAISSEKDCQAFTSTINTSLYKKILYVHAVGVYPFELNEEGSIEVKNDHDGDGIDDRVMEMSHDAFFAMTKALSTIELPLTSLIFGGVADKFKPTVHKSWWSVMKKIKERMLEIVKTERNISFFILNISSVICPHEMLTRPFVFTKTNANPYFWLMPHEVANKVKQLTLRKSSGFNEVELFYKSDYYESDYFEDIKFTRRKRFELGI